jgi:hypothetical protein
MIVINDVGDSNDANVDGTVMMAMAMVFTV